MEEMKAGTVTVHTEHGVVVFEIVVDGGAPVRVSVPEACCAPLAIAATEAAKRLGWEVAQATHHFPPQEETKH